MRRLPIAVCAVLLTAVLLSCSEEHHSYVRNPGPGTPTMTTLNVNTFISDSGYTRYFITTPVWQIYDDADTPYWRFPEGLELEQYDLSLHPASNMRCDSATYFSTMRLWRLDGHVVMVNVQRDSFLTEQVYWDQMRREVYSDSFVHIVRSDRIIEGYGFSSNETMSRYSVNRPTGIFPVERNLTQDNSQSDTGVVAAPSLRERHGAPVRASEREPEPALNLNPEAPRGLEHQNPEAGRPPRSNSRQRITRSL